MKSTPAGAAGTSDCPFNSFNKQMWTIHIQAPPLPEGGAPTLAGVKGYSAANRPTAHPSRCVGRISQGFHVSPSEGPVLIVEGVFIKNGWRLPSNVLITEEVGEGQLCSACPRLLEAMRDNFQERRDPSPCSPTSSVSTSLPSFPDRSPQNGCAPTGNQSESLRIKPLRLISVSPLCFAHDAPLSRNLLLL